MLVGFCKAYIKASETPPALALTYLAVPIALSHDMEPSFSATNAATGLLAWLNRYPDLRLDLGDRLDASKDIVSSAVRLGLSSRALALNDGGTLTLGAAAPSMTKADDLPEEPKGAVRRAQRLGTWMGKAGTAASVFSALGVVP
ncbi:three component ABC system middle component [Ensifer aridi]|uniref:three component ABC system middle component n=1 Tax=Ensifer aridi TaxID=1708715 RepID=UPI00111C842E|nr:three component ABC system middle component [Ensifer aridi]